MWGCTGSLNKNSPINPPPTHTNMEQIELDRTVTPPLPTVPPFGCNKRKCEWEWMRGNLSHFHCSVDVSPIDWEEVRSYRLGAAVNTIAGWAGQPAGWEVYCGVMREPAILKSPPSPEGSLPVTACKKSQVITELPRPEVPVKSRMIYTRAALLCFLPCLVWSFTLDLKSLSQPYPWLILE